MIWYDKAEWHYGGDYPKKLPQENSYRHIAFYLDWALKRGLYSTDLKEIWGDELKLFEAGKIDAIEFLKKMDGKLGDSAFNEEGKTFSDFYYEKKYFDDYFKVLDPDDQYETYEIPYSAENLKKMAAHLDKQFEKFFNPGILSKLFRKK